MVPPFIKLIRQDDDGPAFEILRNYPVAMNLLLLIALRAKRTSSKSLIGIEPGESLIGDYLEIGATRGSYRYALQKLQEWKIVTIKTTNKGTIVKLIDSRIFDVNIEDSNQQNNQPTTNQQPTNNQPTTNELDCLDITTRAPARFSNAKNEKNEKKNTNTPSRAHGTLEELCTFAVELGLPASDGEDRFDQWEANGWVNGKTKIPIKDWKAAMRTLKKHGWLASQEVNSPVSKQRKLVL